MNENRKSVTAVFFDIKGTLRYHRSSYRKLSVTVSYNYHKIVNLSGPLGGKIYLLFQTKGFRKDKINMKKRNDSF